MRASHVSLFGGTRTVRISANQTNYNLHTALGSPAGAVKATVIIDSGVTISSNNPSTPAFDEGSLANGSTVTIINNGKIYGVGGTGGTSQGAAISEGGLVTYNGTATNGGTGGTALKLSAPTIILNAAGEIFGGGGGGGSGAIVEVQDDGIYVAAGGGGGGGRGGGTSSGGVSGSVTGFYVLSSYQGDNGSTGSSAGAGAGGVGGDGTAVGGAFNGGTGGAGGDWATAGSNGGAFTAPYYASSSGPTNGGAAGKAVDLNGKTVTWISGNDSTHVKGAVS